MSASRFDRQSFLGSHSDAQITSFRIGIAGLGGGGSHIAQQLAHLGFVDYALFDDQRIEETNLNRLVGATEADVGSCTRSGLRSSMTSMSGGTESTVLIHRNTPLEPIRSGWGRTCFPARLAPLRAGLDLDHLQPEPGRLGPGLRRPGHRHGHPGPATAPLNHHQHQGGKLPAQGEAQGGSADA